MFTVVEIPSEEIYTNLFTLTGLDEDESLLITNNTSRPAFVIQATFQPAASSSAYPLRSGETILVHNNLQPVWIRGSTGPLVVQELTSTITPFTGVDLPETVYSNTTEHLRRLKISSEPSLAAAVFNGLAYTISGSHSVLSGNYIAFNISPASQILIHKITTNSGLPIDVYSAFATGTADGIFSANNMNLDSVDESPTQGQIYNPAILNGSILYSGITSVEPYVISSFGNSMAAVVKNTTGSTATIQMTITFEELGPREFSFGLTASTLLLSTTEMSDFG